MKRCIVVFFKKLLYLSVRNSSQLTPYYIPLQSFALWRFRYFHHLFTLLVIILLLVILVSELKRSSLLFSLLFNSFNAHMSYFRIKQFPTRKHKNTTRWNKAFCNYFMKRKRKRFVVKRETDPFICKNKCCQTSSELYHTTRHQLLQTRDTMK